MKTEGYQLERYSGEMYHHLYEYHVTQGAYFEEPTVRKKTWTVYLFGIQTALFKMCSVTNVIHIKNIDTLFETLYICTITTGSPY